MSLSTLFGVTLFPPFDFGPPATVNAQPDPAETSWTLGPGGATWDGSLAAGFSLGLATQLLNNGLPVPFSSLDVPSAAVWPGGSGALLFAPLVAWDAANGGAPQGRLKLTIGANSTATLEPGDYHLRLAVTSASTGSVSLGYDGVLRLVGSPGSEAVRAVYASYADLRREYDQVDTLADQLSDEAGFIDVREKISDELDRMLVKRLDPQPGMTKTRRLAGNFDPVIGMDVYDPTAVAPGQHELSGYLADGGLILERDLRVLAACMAIAEILGRQVTSGRDEYQQAADRFRQRAMAKWESYQAQVDTDADGVADLLLINCNVIFLPTGTAP